MHSRTTWTKANPGPGRPKGCKDKAPRVTTLRRILREYLGTPGGAALVIKAIESILRRRATQLPGLIALGQITAPLGTPIGGDEDAAPLHPWVAAIFQVRAELGQGGQSVNPNVVPIVAIDAVPEPAPRVLPRPGRLRAPRDGRPPERTRRG